MLLREFATGLGVGRNVAAKIADAIPGVHREQLAPGQVPAIVLPDDALEYVNDHPELLEAARAQAVQPSATRRGVDLAPI